MKTKEIKLDGYTLPERIKAKMILTLFKTHQAKKELGFTLCSNPDNIIVASEDIFGISDGIEIDPRLCKKDEKFLGGYHTHPTEDSSASAEDLHHCGILKIVCVGGKTDNKIRCNIWKHEQQSTEEYNKMVYDIRKGVTKYENSKYQPNFDCIRSIGPLFLDEKSIKEKDKDLKKKKLDVLALTNVSDHEIIEAGTDLLNDTIKLDMRYSVLKKQIEDKSKKYYNKIEIV
jgi:proteasome lid subunit RPN8/RPN11